MSNELSAKIADSSLTPVIPSFWNPDLQIALWLDNSFFFLIGDQYNTDNSCMTISQWIDKQIDEQYFIRLICFVLSVLLVCIQLFHQSPKQKSYVNRKSYVNWNSSQFFSEFTLFFGKKNNYF